MTAWPTQTAHTHGLHASQIGWQWHAYLELLSCLLQPQQRALELAIVLHALSLQEGSHGSNGEVTAHVKAS